MTLNMHIFLEILLVIAVLILVIVIAFQSKKIHDYKKYKKELTDKVNMCDSMYKLASNRVHQLERELYFVDTDKYTLEANKKEGEHKGE